MLKKCGSILEKRKRQASGPSNENASSDTHPKADVLARATRQSAGTGSAQIRWSIAPNRRVDAADLNCAEEGEGIPMTAAASGFQGDSRSTAVSIAAQIETYALRKSSDWIDAAVLTRCSFPGGRTS